MRPNGPSGRGSPMSGDLTKRGFLQGSAMAAALAGTGSFFGPWSHNRAFAQSKPLKLGLTCDASGQYGNSGQDDLRGIRIAIDEFNAKGGVLGRKIEWITADTETTPATGTRIAERFIREECSFLSASVRNAVESIGKSWLLLTNDYVWGHTTSNATKALVEASGGRIMDNLLVP